MITRTLRIAALVALLAGPSMAQHLTFTPRPATRPLVEAPSSATDEDARSFDEQPALSLSWGTFGLADSEELFRVGLEYRFRPAFWDLRPIVGTSVLEDGGNYVYAGLRYEWNLGGRWQLAPSFATGVYSPGTVDLGGPLEFRSGLDLSYRITERMRFAAGIYHLSNGGVYSRNSGAEALVFSLTHAL